MNTRVQQPVNKKIVTFNPRLLERGMIRAYELGISFQEYLRHLLVNDLQRSEVPTVDTQTARRIKQSMDEYRAGKYTEVDPTDEKQLNLAAGLNK